MDANGDGVGDFQGLMRRLDYLQGLGITTLWLMPFQPSPCRVHPLVDRVWTSRRGLPGKDLRRSSNVHGECQSEMIYR
jgi:glycosidase